MDESIRILIVIEHDNQRCHPATANLLGAAEKFKAFGAVTVDLLIAGCGCAQLAQECTQFVNAGKVLLVDHQSCSDQLAETLAPLVASLAPAYSHLLMASTTTGKNLLPRAAALVNMQPISEVIAILAVDIFMRPIYAGSGIATLASDDPIKFLLIRASAFEPVDLHGQAGTMEILPAPSINDSSELVEQVLTKNERPELTAAKVIVAGGRGLQFGKNFDLLYQLADKLGAAVGASRAAVDAGFVANDLQVGQTGKIVAPDLYIAVGISGAVQHLAGMKDSKVILAINKDPDAPIFQIADYGLVADLFEVLPELIEKIP